MVDVFYIIWNYGLQAVPREWVDIADVVIDLGDVKQAPTLTTIAEYRQAMKEEESSYRVMSAGRRFGRSNTKPDLDRYDG